ncbi:acyl-CoA dehydrogenase family protein [Robbsia andropogonis]|uniref:acyl-CoA dehydrogenase family protein n=1 Tax=Robbsia andropogonis TaxID=28092 RepID=UPI0004647660|nr:acyl-CoA dehydrogenase family protein [Robbsia andropogonis]
MSANPITLPERQPIGHRDPVGTAVQLAKSFALRAEAHDRSGVVNSESLDVLRSHGLTSLTVPTRLGGPDIPLPQVVDVIGTIAQADPATALILSMQLYHSRAVAHSSTWPQAVKDEVLRSVLHDGALINALRVEPELGSPSRGGVPATTAHRTRDGWRLSGRKRYSTGSSQLRWGIVWAATADNETQRVGEFLVPLNADGVSVEETWDHLGLRASDSHDVIFKDVALPTQYAVDIRPNDAWKGKDVPLNAWLPILLAALYDGVARSANAWLLRWIASRTPSSLGTSLSAVPRIRQAVGEIAGLLETNALLLWQAKHQYDVHLYEDRVRHANDNTFGPPSVSFGLVKYTVTQNAIAAINKAVEISGNHALSRHNPLERHFRDVLCSRIHHPQNDLILDGAGTHALDAQKTQSS